MANNIINELEDWFSERPLWLQDAIIRIISKGCIEESDLKELVMICKTEVGIENPSGTVITPNRVKKGTIRGEEKCSELVLEKISDISGINALSPKKPLEFGVEPICIVYGRNGSGKSSYVRTFKHACGVRNPGKLLGNVYGQQDAPKTCIFHYKIESENKQIQWSSGNGVINDLKAIEIYDTDCAHVYVNDENEVTYEPWMLSLFTQLTNVCTKVNEELQNEIEHNISRKPVLPADHRSSQLGKWYNTISNKTTKSEVSEKCLWNKDYDVELESLRQRLVETNPVEKAKLLRQQIENINKLLEHIELLKTGLGREVCEQYINLKNDATNKRKAADEDAKKVFEASPIEGVGTESWRLLWEQARIFSQTIAYQGYPYPNISEGSKCVLCHQDLNMNTKKRLLSFEEFVKGNIEKQAKQAELIYRKAQEKLVEIPKTDIISLLMNSIGITDESEKQLIIAVFNSFKARRESLIEADNISNVSELPNTEELLYFGDQIKAIDEQACAFEEDAQKDNKETITIRIKELEAQKWLSQQRQSIEDEISRLKVISKLEEAKRRTATQGLSIKKSDLSDHFVTEAYIERFQKELKALGAPHIKVELQKTRTQRGHVYHQIRLKGCTGFSTKEILSEGEARIVSMAAFLADVEGRQGKAPFIFDDPISSLDQDYEEAAVVRLVELSKSRQVIVFTHRLSLLTLLEESAKKEGIDTNIICLRNESWSVGEPSDTPINAKRPDTALNTLINDRLPKAKKALEDFGQENYELYAKGICSDFRILIERFIEYRLLGDIVQRFRRAINTLGKLEKLTLIKADDCKLIDDLMTKYSRFEHAQSYELPVNPPLPEELKSDMEKLKEWQLEFSRRG